MLDLNFEGVEAIARKIGRPGTFVVVGPTDRTGKIAIVARRDNAVIKAKVRPPTRSPDARRCFIAALHATGADVRDSEDQARGLRSARRVFRKARIEAARDHTRRAEP
jgi:hypothetical protein